MFDLKEKPRKLMKKISTRRLFVLKQEFIGLGGKGPSNHWLHPEVEGHHQGRRVASPTPNPNIWENEAAIACPEKFCKCQRDHVKHDLLSKRPVDDDMQDMLGYVSSQENVVLATLDYARLTTNSDDLKTFLENNPNVRKIIVDNIPHTSKIIDY
ncbi:hypothetical protein DFQ28_002830 [Apophysomyces sp. BC1034]|nr:hypothetical protein DFQ30_003104 [Apophysomyces sp. BC1015]KAG0179490.1 hypothetical protein DFQ29_002034 [Apophysomyces sp. BC1021]KAG0189855.1 hypothetical protein DFQ28_002830 [Apophysomyces sp. BC1034]